MKRFFSGWIEKTTLPTVILSVAFSFSPFWMSLPHHIHCFVPILLLHIFTLKKQENEKR
jgi:hypothetical protein